MNYTIKLTPAQFKALEYAIVDVQEWIENLVYVRCEVAMQKILDQEIERITNCGGTISGTKDDIILASPIKSAKEMQDNYLALSQEERLELEQSLPSGG